MALRPPDFKSGASADSATPLDLPGVYQSGLPAFGGAAGVLRVGILQATQSPFGDRVGDGAGEVEGCEGVEAFDVPTLADACDPGSVAGEVVGVDLFDRLFANLFLRDAHAPG
jgi:hypothetical protein